MGHAGGSVLEAVSKSGAVENAGVIDVAGRFVGGLDRQLRFLNLHDLRMLACVSMKCWGFVDSIVQFPQPPSQPREGSDDYKCDPCVRSDNDEGSFDDDDACEQQIGQSEFHQQC